MLIGIWTSEAFCFYKTQLGSSSQLQEWHAAARARVGKAVWDKIHCEKVLRRCARDHACFSEVVCFSFWKQTPDAPGASTYPKDEGRSKVEYCLAHQNLATHISHIRSHPKHKSCAASVVGDLLHEGAVPVMHWGPARCLNLESKKLPKLRRPARV